MIDDRDKRGVATELKWLKGHAQDKGNIAADALAVNGARMGRDERRSDEARARAEENATMPLEDDEAEHAADWL